MLLEGDDKIETGFTAVELTSQWTTAHLCDWAVLKNATCFIFSKVSKIC